MLEELAGFVSNNTDRSEENKSNTISKVLNEISITGFPGNSYQDLPETGLVSNPLKNTSLQEPGMLKSPSLIQYQIYDGWLSIRWPAIQGAGWYSLASAWKINQVKAWSSTTKVLFWSSSKTFPTFDPFSIQKCNVSILGNDPKDNITNFG